MGVSLAALGALAGTFGGSPIVATAQSTAIVAIREGFMYPGPGGSSLLRGRDLALATLVADTRCGERDLHMRQPSGTFRPICNRTEQLHLAPGTPYMPSRIADATWPVSPAPPYADESALVELA
jgi:hypothetical protein